MAQNVMGLDLGSFSVKAVVVKMGLRGGEIVAFDAEPVELDREGNSSPAGVMDAAGRLLERMKQPVEALHCAIPGDAATIRLVGLPVSAARRLEQVLRFELDEVLPYDIEDAVFDYVEVGRTGEEIRLLCAVTPTEKVGDILAGLAPLGMDPREVGIASLAYAVDFQGESDDARGDTAVVDIGHRRTNVAIHGSRVPTVRTILRGGRDLTAKLADVGRVDFPVAETHKLREGLRSKVGEVLREALKPLVREIRQTMKGHLATGGRRVTKVLVCGGTARMEGLERLLADELGVPVERYGAPVGTAIRTLETALHPEDAVLGHALARSDEVARARRFNVRRGSLVFRGDYEYLKSRIIWVVAFAFLILSSWIFSNYAQYSLLDDQVEAQRKLIGEETLRLFGESTYDQEEIEGLLGSGVVGEDEPPMPVKDAFDIVVELSRRIPPSVVHDVEVLDIKPKRITIRAIVDSELQEASRSGGASDSDDEGFDGEEGDEGDEIGEGDRGDEESTKLSPTDLIHQKLMEFKECFTAIRIGKVQTVGDRRQYQMDIDTKCP
jgi:type IV pilus assembly protein PilM